MRDRVSICYVLVLFGFALIGCEAPLDYADSGESKSADGRTADGSALPDESTLKAWAQELGESELRKLAAAEMIYRNAVFEHLLEGDLSVSCTYMKLYRQFREFEVVDIARSESILRPVRYTIRYDYDLLGTSTEHQSRVRDLSLAREAASDMYFSKITEDSLTRTYDSDGIGRPVNNYPPQLERPNYWQYQTRVEFFGHRWSLADVSQFAVQ